VEVEKDLSIKLQLLDVVIVRKDAAPLSCRLPDGFEELATHNLISFKSYQEALDGWALNELIGHYVNYRKQASPTMQDLLPETDFRLYAVCVRFPQSFAKNGTLKPVKPGVYEVDHFTGVVRLIVVHELPKEEQNAMLHLFSARAELVQYGCEHHQLRSSETTSFLYQLFDRYHSEVPFMGDLLEQLHEETVREMLKKLSPEKRVAGLSAEEILKSIPPEKRVEGLSADQLLAVLSPETRAALAEHFKRSSAPEPEGPKP
jgi:hypothetical protein